MNAPRTGNSQTISFSEASRQIHGRFRTQEVQKLGTVVAHILDKLAPQMNADDLVQLLAEVLLGWFHLSDLSCYRQVASFVLGRFGEDGPAVLAEVLYRWCLIESDDEIIRVFDLPTWEHFRLEDLLPILEEAIMTDPLGMVMSWEQAMKVLPEEHLVSFNRVVLRSLPREMTLPAQAFAWFSWQKVAYQPAILDRVLWNPDSLCFLIRLGLASKAAPDGYPKKLNQKLQEKLLNLFSHLPHAGPGLIRLALSVEGFGGSDWYQLLMSRIQSWGWQITKLQTIEVQQEPNSQEPWEEPETFQRLAVVVSDGNRQVTYFAGEGVKEGDQVFAPTAPSYQLPNELRARFTPACTIRKGLAGLFMEGYSLQPVSPLVTSDCPEACGEDLFVLRD